MMPEFISKIIEEVECQEIYVNQYVWGNACGKLTGAVFYVKDNKFLGGYSLHTWNDDIIIFHNIKDLKKFINKTKRAWGDCPNCRYELELVVYKDCKPVKINDLILEKLQ
jgi:hypothetical protein